MERPLLALPTTGLAVEITTSDSPSLLLATIRAQISLPHVGSHTIRWTDPDDAEQHESTGCRGAEYQRRVTPHKIGCGNEEFFNRLTPHGLGKLLDLLSDSPHQPRQLRSILVETICGGSYRLRNVTGKIGAGLDLVLQKSFGLIAGLRGKRGCGLLRVAAHLLNCLRELRDGLTGLGAEVHLLLRIAVIARACGPDTRATGPVALTVCH
jgi:hypothetical protein